jgi:glycosyltransferase involved in cell wall biosynthesis
MPSHNILHIFASATWGGGEQYIFDLAKKQIENGHHVTLVSGSSEAIMVKVSSLQCPYFTIKHRWHFNPFSISRMRRIVLHEKIDIVHVHQFRDAFIAVFANLFIAKSKRTKVAMTRHLVRQGKNSCLYRWLYCRLHKLIFVSELAKKEFLRGVQVPENKIIVIHNSIVEKPAEVSAINYRKHCGVDDGCVLIGFVGRIVAFKGVELLLSVAEKMRGKNIAFLLAGSGKAEYEDFINEQIVSKGLEQHFFLVGFLDNPADFITQMNIGILPSLCVESFGLSVLEFMQQGVPVIASNTGAQVEFMEHEKTGLLVNPTVETVTKALVKLLDDKEFREKIGRNAKDFCAKEFNYNRFYNSIMHVYNS